MNTSSIKHFNGIPVIVPNIVPVEGINFHISYNDFDIGVYGCDTTALVLSDGVHCEEFYILNGNHVDAYKQAKDANGLQGCKDYFKKNIHLINKHSDKLDTSIIKVDGKWKIVKLDNPKW